MCRPIPFYGLQVLFTAGFGLRPALAADYLTGISFLFEDPYTIGEKVELVGDVQALSSMSAFARHSAFVYRRAVHHSQRRGAGHSQFPAGAFFAG